MSTTQLQRDVIGDIKVIDVDTHLTEPHDLWTHLAPPAGRSASRTCARSTAGRCGCATATSRRTWAVRRSILPDGEEGRRHRVPRVRHRGRPRRRRTTSTPRLEMMDRWASTRTIVYPNVVGFGGQKFNESMDPELRIAVRHDLQRRDDRDAGTVGRQRLFPMALVPWWDIDGCGRRGRALHAPRAARHQHQRRPARLGHARSRPARLGPVLGGLRADLEMPVNFHIGASRRRMSWFGHVAVAVTRRPGDASSAIGVGDDVPRQLPLDGRTCWSPASSSATRSCKFVSVESGSAGSRSCSRRSTTSAARRAPHTVEPAVDEAVGVLPAARSTAASGSRAGTSQPTIDALGADHIMFETDFPHPTCLYPDSLERGRRRPRRRRAVRPQAIAVDERCRSSTTSPSKQRTGVNETRRTRTARRQFAGS